MTLNNFCVYQLHNLVRRIGACKIHNMQCFWYLSLLGDGSLVIDSLVICALNVCLCVGRRCCDWSLFCYALLSGLSLLQSSGLGRNYWLLYFHCLLASSVN